MKMQAFLKSIGVYLAVLIGSTVVALLVSSALSDGWSGRESIPRILIVNSVVILVAAFYFKKGRFVASDLFPLFVGELLIYYFVTSVSGSPGFDSVNLSWMIGGNLAYIAPWFLGVLLKSFKNARLQ